MGFHELLHLKQLHSYANDDEERMLYSPLIKEKESVSTDESKQLISHSSPDNGLKSKFPTLVCEDDDDSSVRASPLMRGLLSTPVCKKCSVTDSDMAILVLETPADEARTITHRYNNCSNEIRCNAIASPLIKSSVTGLDCGDALLTLSLSLRTSSSSSSINEMTTPVASSNAGGLRSFRDPFPTPNTAMSSSIDAASWNEKIKDLYGGSFLLNGGSLLLSEFDFNDENEDFEDTYNIFTPNIAAQEDLNTATSTPFDTNTFFPRRRRRTREIFLPSPQRRERAVIALQRIKNTSKRIGRKLKLPRPCRPTWLIPADHPVKLAWDVSTVCISLVSAYVSHTSIRERDYDQSGFLIRFCEIWFLVDILLNFVTQYQAGGSNIQHGGGGGRSLQSVWARYLTTWFIIDVISFIPWEKIWVKPIVEMQKRRTLLQKTGRRSKVVLQIGRMLRGRHIRWFKNVTRWTKSYGYDGSRLLALIIKYIPKYLMFIKNMKAVLAVRMLRQIHWVGKVINHMYYRNNGKVEDEEEEEEEDKIEEEIDDETFCEEDSFENEENKSIDYSFVGQLDQEDDDPYEPPFC